MSYFLPNPCLLGLLFIVSSHGGPQLIFNHPEDLGFEAKDDSKDDDGESSDEDDEENLYTEEFRDMNSDAWDADNMKFYTGTKKDVILFLDDLERRRNHQKKPVKKKNQPRPNDTGKIFDIEQNYLYEMLCPPKQMCNTRFEITIDDKIFLGLPIHVLDDGTWRPHSRKKEKEIKKAPYNMFHLVFVMNPPIIEQNYRIDEMFHYVVSRLSLVLRYEELKNEYLSTEIKQILRLKEENDENIHSKLIDQSSLCRALYECYDAISQSKIANLIINHKLRSFQIPVKNGFYSLPELTSPYLPGSYLSTTVSLIDESFSASDDLNDTLDEYDNEDTHHSLQSIAYFALLLLDDPESIITDIQAHADGNLANFIRTIKPTETLLKLSLRSSFLNLNQIKSFAFHLLYWRRARIIQPLSTRSVYIVSPLAPITINLFPDIRKFNREFSTLPSLPHFLKLLSSNTKKPRQFATIIPSRDHKDLYLSALGWLIRYGYVTQLQTFIWLKISKKIKIKVEEDLENQNHRKRSTKISIPLSTDNTSKNAQNDTKEIENLELRLKLLAQGPDIVLEEDDDTVLIDPGRATALERKWISKIIEDCSLSKELTALFYKLLKYMNGKNSLELLLARENVSRSELRSLLLAIEEYIISVRHW